MCEEYFDFSEKIFFNFHPGCVFDKIGIYGLWHREVPVVENENPSLTWEILGPGDTSSKLV